ncbi:MAG: preprotein translocase subunit SecE [Candidatus Omnitrophica bacterium]|nr:preprotein translocase subunit SecE [Candidatus Omnitrophota bacterium]
MKLVAKVTNFLNEVKTELTKVSWPNRQELLGSTIVVIVLTAILTVFIFIVDSALAKLLSIILKS